MSCSFQEDPTILTHVTPKIKGPKVIGANGKTWIEKFVRA